MLFLNHHLTGKRNSWVKLAILSAVISLGLILCIPVSADTEVDPGSGSQSGNSQSGGNEGATRSGSAGDGSRGNDSSAGSKSSQSTGGSSNKGSQSTGGSSSGSGGNSSGDATKGNNNNGNTGPAGGSSDRESNGNGGGPGGAGGGNGYGGGNDQGSGGGNTEPSFLSKAKATASRAYAGVQNSVNAIKSSMSAMYDSFFGGSSNGGSSDTFITTLPSSGATPSAKTEPTNNDAARVDAYLNDLTQQRKINSDAAAELRGLSQISSGGIIPETNKSSKTSSGGITTSEPLPKVIGEVVVKFELEFHSVIKKVPIDAKGVPVINVPEGAQNVTVEIVIETSDPALFETGNLSKDLANAGKKSIDYSSPINKSTVIGASTANNKGDQDRQYVEIRFDGKPPIGPSGAKKEADNTYTKPVDPYSNDVVANNPYGQNPAGTVPNTTAEAVRATLDATDKILEAASPSAMENPDYRKAILAQLALKREMDSPGVIDYRIIQAEAVAVAQRSTELLEQHLPNPINAQTAVDTLTSPTTETVGTVATDIEPVDTRTAQSLGLPTSADAPPTFDPADLTSPQAYNPDSPVALSYKVGRGALSEGSLTRSWESLSPNLKKFYNEQDTRTEIQTEEAPTKISYEVDTVAPVDSEAKLAADAAALGIETVPASTRSPLGTIANLAAGVMKSVTKAYRGVRGIFSGSPTSLSVDTGTPLDPNQNDLLPPSKPAEVVTEVRLLGVKGKGSTFSSSFRVKECTAGQCTTTDITDVKVGEKIGETEVIVTEIQNFTKDSLGVLTFESTGVKVMAEGEEYALKQYEGVALDGTPTLSNSSGNSVSIPSAPETSPTPTARPTSITDNTVFAEKIDNYKNYQAEAPSDFKKAAETTRTKEEAAELWGQQTGAFKERVTNSGLTTAEKISLGKVENTEKLSFGDSIDTSETSVASADETNTPNQSNTIVEIRAGSNNDTNDLTSLERIARESLKYAGKIRFVLPRDTATLPNSTPQSIVTSLAYLNQNRAYIQEIATKLRAEGHVVEVVEGSYIVQNKGTAAWEYVHLDTTKLPTVAPGERVVVVGDSNCKRGGDCDSKVGKSGAGADEIATMVEKNLSKVMAERGIIEQSPLTSEQRTARNAAQDATSLEATKVAAQISQGNLSFRETEVVSPEAPSPFERVSTIVSAVTNAFTNPREFISKGIRALGLGKPETSLDLSRNDSLPGEKDKYKTPVQNSNNFEITIPQNPREEIRKILNKSVGTFNDEVAGTEITVVDDFRMTEAAFAVAKEMETAPEVEYKVAEIDAMLGKEFAKQGDVRTAQAHAISAQVNAVLDESTSFEAVERINEHTKELNAITADYVSETPYRPIEPLTENRLTNLNQILKTQQVAFSDAVLSGLATFPVSVIDIETAGVTFAGELDYTKDKPELLAAYKAYAETGTWPEITPALADALGEAGIVITSSINRAAHRGTSIESEFLRKDQFSAFNNSNIDNTIASYNLNPEAWKVIATAYLDGTFAATYGLDTINPLDKVDHYRVPGLSSSASDTWAANMKTIGVFNSGHIAYDGWYQPGDPNLGQNANFFDKLAKIPSRVYRALSPTLEITSDDKIQVQDNNIVLSTSNYDTEGGAPETSPTPTTRPRAINAPRTSPTPTERPTVASPEAPSVWDKISGSITNTIDNLFGSIPTPPVPLGSAKPDGEIVTVEDASSATKPVVRLIEYGPVDPDTNQLTGTVTYEINGQDVFVKLGELIPGTTYTAGQNGTPIRYGAPTPSSNSGVPLDPSRTDLLPSTTKSPWYGDSFSPPEEYVDIFTESSRIPDLTGSELQEVTNVASNALRDAVVNGEIDPNSETYKQTVNDIKTSYNKIDQARELTNPADVARRLNEARTELSQANTRAQSLGIDLGLTRPVPDNPILPADSSLVGKFKSFFTSFSIQNRNQIST